MTYLFVKGNNIALPGQPIGQGLCPKAASDLGLRVGTAVGASLIDAYAGCLGTIGINLSKIHINNEDITSRLSLICGTSTCHMAV